MYTINIEKIGFKNYLYNLYNHKNITKLYYFMY